MEETFDSVRTRLDEIVSAVNSDDISLDDALALYEEAVKLSLAACDLSESDLKLDEAQTPPSTPSQEINTLDNSVTE